MREMSRPVITFLSDYGLADHFVGVCHAVIAGICPDARVIDLAHGVPRHDVRAGALTLRGALPFTPVGVHIAVVDPDVGAERRAVALRVADGRILVGPDNGVLMPAAELAGVVEAVDIAHSRFRLEPVSATFHGRDIFAAVAARLAAGAGVAEAGTPIDPAALVALELPRARHAGDELIVHVVYIDRFGNVALDAAHDDLPESGLRLGRRAYLALAAGVVVEVPFVRTFADVGHGETLLYEDADRRLALAVAHGDAAATLNLSVDDEFRIRPA
jgi:S-adenosylmethionine hydrolase